MPPRSHRATALCLACLWLAAASPCGTAVIPNGIGIGDPEATSNLNPLLAGDINSLQQAILLYRPLVWIGRNIDFDPERSLAASVQALDGNTRFRLTLKPWRWSDGTAVTADDVLYGWQSLSALDDHGLYPSEGQGGIPAGVADVRGVDARTVDFTLKAAANPEWFILNGLSLIYALPRHAWGRIGAEEMWQRQNDPSLFRVVDGPFRLAEWRPDRYAAFEPNPLYGGHMASLARLVVVFLAGANAVRAAQAGETDMARVPYALWQRLHGDPHFRFLSLPEPYGYWDLILNQRNKNAAFLRNQVVRRALAMAIDQTEIIRLAYAGQGSENHAPAPTAPATWRSPDLPDLHYDPQAARALLRQAGWAGKTLSFTVLTQADPDAPESLALQVAQRNLRDVGVDMQLRTMPASQLIATIFSAAADWQAASQPITPAPMPDGGGYFDTKGGQNFGAYSDARMDRLIADASTSAGRQALFAYQDFAAAEQPDIFLPQGNFLLMAAPRLRGVADFVHSMGLWSPEYLSVHDPACPAPAP